MKGTVVDGVRVNEWAVIEAFESLEYDCIELDKKAQYIINGIDGLLLELESIMVVGG